MPEVTITLPDPAKTAALLKDAAAAAGSGGCNHTAGMHARWLADQIKEQVKPAIEEPTEFGSLIRANTGGGRQLLQRPGQARGKHYWENEDGGCWLWSELTDVEVLRIGVGEPAEKTDGFCTCDVSGKDTDCGIRAHRQMARRAERIWRDPMDDGPDQP